MWLALIVGFVVGCIVSLAVKALADARRLKDVKVRAEGIIAEAKDKAKDIIYSAQVRAKDEERRILEEVKEREKKVSIVEAELNMLRNTLEEKGRKLKEVEETLGKKEDDIRKRRAEVERRNSEISELLQKIAGMTRDEAVEALISEVKQDAEKETAKIIKTAEENALRRAEEISTKIIMTAIQRCTFSYNYDRGTSYVTLPDDSLKGRIIGRDGRNIRSFEQITGVDVIIDDTPGVVAISCFDPVRRDIARLAMQRLIEDGRIHPARIEEIVEWARKEVEDDIVKVGRETIHELEIRDIHHELVKLVGKLKYRASYMQNVLEHSREVAYIAGHIAWELGLDGNLARRIGILHDVGKAMDHTVEGSHVEVGVEILERYGEKGEIVEAIRQHHLEKPSNIYGIIVQVADALSASRPGARMDTYDMYIKRIEELEKIATSFEGVDKAWALRAGREIRVMVKPEEIADEKICFLARDLARKIEKELKYPGEIKVVVIREVKAQETAR